MRNTQTSSRADVQHGHLEKKELSSTVLVWPTSRACCNVAKLYQSQHLFAQAAQEFVGYRTPCYVQLVYVAFVVLSGGLLWVVACCLPQRPLWTLQKCSLKDAEQVLVQVQPLTLLQLTLSRFKGTPQTASI